MSQLTSAYLSWGRAHRFHHHAVAARDARLDGRGPMLAYGMGRSYGDSCLNENGVLLDTRGMDRFVAFDPSTGVLEAEAGVGLADVLASIGRPSADGSAWLPAVMPGTRWVSLGGAVANDVHGKNHHLAGSFGCHVSGLRLRRSDGRTLACSPLHNAELFRATIGGLGLTGLIETVTLALRRVPGLMLVSEDIRMASLDEFYALSAASQSGWEYTAAWVDCLAKGGGVGRGIFTRANHVPGPIGPTASRSSGLTVPVAPPVSPLNRWTLRLFNALYRRRLGWRRQRRRLTPYGPALFPLDAIGGWNRLYGKTGFYQYQCVVPADAARGAVEELLSTVAAAGEGSFLAVLKTMGNRHSPGLLSFPMPGTTLALDFPNRGGATVALLDRLDQITTAARGRVYPAKDGRMSAAVMAAGQPGLDRFRASIDPAFSSSFWRRAGGEPVAARSAA